MSKTCKNTMLIGLVLTVLSMLAVPMCQAAAPICPHVIGWNLDIQNWASTAPWVKVITANDAEKAKAVGVKVFYRPYDADSVNHDDGCLPSNQTGTQYADLVWAKLNTLNPKPEVVGYRNEFNWDNPTCSKRTCAEFVNYYNRLRADGYTGKIVFGSFGVGWGDSTVWDDVDCRAATDRSDGIEVHEYFDFTVDCGSSLFTYRHRDIAIANHPDHLGNKEWWIGEFGSDRVCKDWLPCSDYPSCRVGWRDNNKLTSDQFIAQCSLYSNNCAPQVVAVFLFQQGSGAWGTFETMGTPVQAWMQTTWTVTNNGTLSGNVKTSGGSNLSGASVTTNTGGYNTLTDVNGNYSLSVAAGTYNVTAAKSGYTSQVQSGKTVTANQTTTCSFTLSPVTPGTITGNVKNTSAQNISGATVATNTGGYTTTTDANGNYTLSSVNPGTYTVTASKSGYASSNQNATVTSGQTTTTNFTLSTASFVGISNKDFEGGSFNDPDADHKTANSWNKFIISGSSKRDVIYGGAHGGNYSQDIYDMSWVAGIYQQATGCTVGTNYTASIWVKGNNTDVKFWVGIDPTGGTDANSANVQWSAQYGPGTTWTQISKQVAASSSTITMFIKAQNPYGNVNYAYFDDADLVAGGGASVGTISGNVKSGGVNLSGATVATNTGGYTTTTDASGNYTLSNVAVGTYNVTASKTGYNSATNSNVSVTANTTTTSNFTVTPNTGTITGNVKNSSAQNISGATVSTNTGGYTTTTDASGNYTLSNVAAGTYNVSASKSGYNTGTNSNVSVTSGNTTTSNFTLTTASGYASQDFETMPTWSSTFDATWGSAANWAITSGGQSANFLQASRTANGSSVKALVYTVPTNTNVTVSIYVKCPSYSGGTYWIESACKLGNNSAQDFDQNSGTWTMIKKFADNGTNGNGNVWTQYSATVATGSNTQITVGVKHGASGCVGPTVGWDTLRIN